MGQCILCCLKGTLLVQIVSQGLLLGFYSNNIVADNVKTNSSNRVANKALQKMPSSWAETLGRPGFVFSAQIVVFRGTLAVFSTVILLL